MSPIKSKKQILNLSFNTAISVFGIIGTVLLFALPLNTQTNPPSYYGAWGLLFFTTLSNIALMLSAIGMVICILLKHYKKIKTIPYWLKMAKFIATTTTTLTMISVLLFLPFTGIVHLCQPYELYCYSNTFFHLLCPLFAIVDFLLFEERMTFNWYRILYAVIPAGVYSIVYLSIALTHIQPGGFIPTKFDWYGLSQFGLNFAPLFVLLSLGCSFLFGWCLWYGNRKIQIKGLEK